MEKKIKINGEEIIVTTLTADVIADLMERLSVGRPATLAEQLMNEDIPEDFVIASTGLTSDWFKGKVTPDDISQVWEAFKEVNGFLSRLLPRLFVDGKQAQPSGQPNSAPQSAK